MNCANRATNSSEFMRRIMRWRTLRAPGNNLKHLDCDIGIIGAGVARLTAAATLRRAGLAVLCLDATDRVGGRILTVRDPMSPLPIELGAEFVRGRPPEIWELIRAHSLAVFEHTLVRFTSRMAKP